VFPKRGAIALGLTAIALVLLVSFKTPSDIDIARTGSTGTTGTTGTTQTKGSTGSTGSTRSTGSTGSTGTSGTSGTGATADTGGATGQGQGGTKTFDGAVVDTRYGPVQVSITVSGGQITAVDALQLPGGDRRSSQISSRAEPMLQSEALQAQSASIDGVSGATYTSEGYAQSLQSALDAAGL
jgi:uncharacterized protein with FMN-binding domain